MGQFSESLSLCYQVAYKCGTCMVLVSRTQRTCSTSSSVARPGKSSVNCLGGEDKVRGEMGGAGGDDIKGEVKGSVKEEEHDFKGEGRTAIRRK